MNDDLMFEYLLEMGAMRPEQEEMRRRQAMVDALRKGSMTPQSGEMVSGHYVPKGIAGAIGQLGTAYMAKQGQAGVDQRMQSMNAMQRQRLERLRRERGMGMGGGGYNVDAVSNEYFGGTP